MGLILLSPIKNRVGYGFKKKKNPQSHCHSRSHAQQHTATPQPHSESILGLILSHSHTISQFTQSLTHSQALSSWIGFGSWSACYLGTLPSISKSKTQGRRPQALSLSLISNSRSRLSPLSISIFIFFFIFIFCLIRNFLRWFGYFWVWGLKNEIFYFIYLGVAVDIWKERIFGIGCLAVGLTLSLGLVSKKLPFLLGLMSLRGLEKKSI